MRWLVGPLVSASCLVAPSAAAGDFDASGNYRFADGAVATLDFESAELPPPADPADPPATRKDSTSALSGGWLVSLGPYESVSFAAELPPTVASYRMSVWIRGGEAVGIVTSSYDGARRDEVAVLYPTGRMTSDGWVELANERIVVDGAAGAVAIGVFSPGGAEIDAVEIAPDGGPASKPGKPCDGLVEGAGCGAGEVCTWGACRRVSGWVPPIPPDRDDVAGYLGNRLEFLFGPYQNRAIDLPAARVALEGMKTAQEPWGFWNGFLLALRRLHDSHTGVGGSMVDYVLRNPRPFDVCFVEGEADWSHGVAPSDPLYRDVLVSHAGAARNLGLSAGDRLVRVDGRHPIDWARATIEVSWSTLSASNHSTYAEQASSLRGLISRYAKELEVVRCTPEGCGGVETLAVASLPPLASDEQFEPQLCDNRPQRHVPGAPVTHQGADGVFAGFLLDTGPDEKLFGVEWDSLYTTTGKDGIGADLQKAIDRVTNEGAEGLLLDHRRGTGGTLRGPEIVWSYTVPRRPLTFFQTRERERDEQPTLAQGKALFAAALASGEVDYAGAVAAKPVPTALLLTSDISASDWLPLGMKGAPNVRIFGPYETSGAFSTRLALGYWLGMSFTLASGDTFVADGRNLNGTGAPPDEVVLPRQSDLAQGKDTVYEAALAWLRAAKGGAP